MPLEEILLKYKDKVLQKSETNDMEDSDEDDLPGPSKGFETAKSSGSTTTVIGMLLYKLFFSIMHIFIFKYIYLCILYLISM